MPTQQITYVGKRRRRALTDFQLRTSVPQQVSRQPRLKDPLDEFFERFELPRQHYQPLDGINFDREAELAVTASMAFTSIVTVTLPSSFEGVVKWIGQGADAVGLFNDTTWRLLINGAAYQDWSAVVFQRGSIAVPAPVTILVPVNGVVTLQIRNNSTNTYTADGFIRGWMWPVRDVRQSNLM